MCHLQGTGGTDSVSHARYRGHRQCVTCKVQGALTVCHMQGTGGTDSVSLARYRGH